MSDAYIVAGARTPVGKAPRGTLRNTRPDDLAAIVIREAIRRATGLAETDIDDVLLGCAMPEGPQGMNVARMACLRAGLPDSVPAMTINRLCASGAETIARAAYAVRESMASVVIAGGTESMSLVPMDENSVSPNPEMIRKRPDVYLSMGLTAENVAREFGVSREEQDAFALESHRKAIAAIDGGRFREEIVPVTVEETRVDEQGQRVTVTRVFDTDEGPRRDTSADALAHLRPVFHVRGTVTAGNSSQRSDGAAAVVVADEKAVARLDVDPLARFVAYAVAGVAPETMGIGPVEAIPKALAQADLDLDDIGVIELNEAFAAQAVAVIREAGLPPEKVNLNGGAIALGHPLGCTGTKLALTAIYEMRRRHERYAMVTMCVGGGMGACLILENCGES